MTSPPTYLSHDLAECHLFEVGGLAAHVGPCDDDKVAALGDVAVVGNGLLARDALQDGVTTLLDSQGVCEFGTHCKQRVSHRGTNQADETHLKTHC